MIWQTAFFLILSIHLSIDVVRAFQIEVGYGEHECFYEKFEKSTNVFFMYEVFHGGFLDILVNVTDPNGMQLFTHSESYQKYNFKTMMDGKYQICFINYNGVSQQTKVLSFVYNGEPSVEMKMKKVANKTEEEALHDEIKKLHYYLKAVNFEVTFMHHRKDHHFEINNNTNQIIKAWCFFETILLLAGSTLQVIYLKKFFEVRSVI